MTRTIRLSPVLMAGMLIVTLSGCEIMGPRVKVEPPRVRVPAIEVEGGGHPGHHCPPGQAKKGRC